MSRAGPSSSAVAIVVGMLVVFGAASPATASTAGPEPATEDPAPADDLELQAAALYDEGQVLYSAANYTGAIAKFTEALALISRPDASFPPDVRGALLYNLATAHDRAFNVEGDLKHLRTARELYGRIVDEAPTYGYSEELVGQATEQGAEVDRRLQEAEAELRPTEPEPEPSLESPEPRPQPEEPAADDVRRPGRALTISGLAVTGLGVASSGIWIAGLVGAQRARDELAATTMIEDEDSRLDAFDRGERSNTLVLSGAVVSGALVGGGIALLVAGRVMAGRSRSTVACAPTLGPRTTAIACSLRF